MYLAHLGYRVANIPLVSGVEPPASLFSVDPGKVFGLISITEVVSTIRVRRRVHARPCLRRAGKRAAAAALRIAIDMVEEGFISRDEALMRIDPSQLDQLLHPQFDTSVWPPYFWCTFVHMRSSGYNIFRMRVPTSTHMTLNCAAASTVVFVIVQSKGATSVYGNQQQEIQRDAQGHPPGRP